ncbi:MAG: hypothetical protein NTZ25_02210 [Candidatus Peregrinibacteria bacterium]|nr:hypothetical protein [Candidatus Peregrinibacteria bacterium]
MPLEPEISMYGKFSEEMDGAGLGLNVEGDCLALDCQQKGLAGLGELVTSIDLVSTVHRLLFSTIDHGREDVKILKMQAYDEDPQAADMEDLSTMINYKIITPEEINLIYLCAAKLLSDSLHVWSESYGDPFQSEELKNVVTALLETKIQSVIIGLGVDGPKDSSSPYSTVRVQDFITYCSRFTRKIVDAAFADAELRQFMESEIRTKAIKITSQTTH